MEAGDGSTFPTAGHLAAYAGLAPATLSSGSSNRGGQLSWRGNKQLKRAFFLSALGASHSLAYCDKGIAQGTHHTQVPPRPALSGPTPGGYPLRDARRRNLL
ncbi:IS110 family transposase [Streptomyces sp. NPDC057499]|uniref:IS110 family transposase n=1 Tax=Streptomyces sp. NPDC057499 TaxID=3346150 RepID=UPI0036CDE831